MTIVYLVCFLLMAIAIVLLLGLTPESITEDIMRFASPKQTLRDKVLTARGKKKSRKLTVELNRIREILTEKEHTAALEMVFMIYFCISVLVTQYA